MRSWLRRLARSEAGAAGVVFALSLPILIGFAAFGADYGSFVLEKQRLRGAVDLAALAAAGQVGREEAAAREVIAANGEVPASLEVTLGSLRTDAAGASVFVPGTPGGAVLVRAGKRAQPFFSSLFLREAPLIDLTAVAVTKPLVSLAAGSTLAGVSGGLTEALTTHLLGARLDLSALGHAGLLRSRITTSGLLDAIADTLGVATGTVGELLDREVDLHVFLRIVARAMAQEGSAGPAADVSRLASTLVGAKLRVSLGEVLALPRDVRDLAISTPASLLGVRVSAASLLGAAISSRDGGTLVEKTLQVPGLTSVDLAAQVGEPMQERRLLAVGEAGSVVETAQIRARLGVKLLTVLGGTNAPVHLPVELMVASGRATAVAATCHSDPARRLVSVEIRPSVARLEITEPRGGLGTITERLGGRPAAILNILSDGFLFNLLRIQVSAYALAPAAPTAPRTVIFRGSEIGDGTVKTVSSDRILSSLVGELFGKLDLDVSLSILSIPLGDILRPLTPVLKAVAVPLDLVLDGLLRLLGVRIGVMDVRVDDLVCATPRLVV